MKINVSEKNKITREMIESAERLSLSVEMITGGSFYLSNGEKKIMFAGCMPETTNAISYKLTNDKFLTNLILKNNEFPVLDMETLESMEQAKKFLKNKKEIVVKPREGIHGKGITVGIKKEAQIKEAAEYAKENDMRERVILEEYYPFSDYRILVIGYKKVFVLNRVPAFIVGDGKSNISDLIDKYNNRKGDYTYPIEKNDLTDKILSEQRCNYKSIISEGKRIFLRKTANIKSGGTAIEVTDELNEEVKNMAIGICKLFKLDIAGIDWISPDITKEEGRFIEINAYPGILLHKHPSEGKAYNVAEELLNYLFFPNKF